jgi:zinc protease
MLAAGRSDSGASRVFPFPFRQRVLPNGLRVVAVPFDSPGLAAHWLIVRVGSRNEIEPGHSGFAHFFEHMMFRGTPRFPEERYHAALKRLGADSNAYTSDDLTAYHTLASAGSLAEIMDLESDRFMNLGYSLEAFQKEARAVLGEYNKNFSFPEVMIDEKLFETAFRVHPYQHTTMGFLRDIEDMPNQYDFSLSFYHRYYRPEHCILLVVGDVEGEEVFVLAEKHYGPWKRGTTSIRIPQEPPQTEERQVALTWPNPTLPILTLGYHVPAFSTRDKEMPALDLISHIAFSDTSPLYRGLVLEEQIAESLHGSAADHRDPTLFVIQAHVKSPAHLERVRQAIEATLRGLQETPVDEARLQATKSHLRYAFQMRLDSPDAVAATLAHILQLTADPGSYEELYATYDSLTASDLQATARRVFRNDNRTVVTLTSAASGGDEAE